jgi:hypothetical protein
VESLWSLVGVPGAGEFCQINFVKGKLSACHVLSS